MPRLCFVSSWVILSHLEASWVISNHLGVFYGHLGPSSGHLGYPHEPGTQNNRILPAFWGAFSDFVQVKMSSKSDPVFCRLLEFFGVLLEAVLALWDSLERRCVPNSLQNTYKNSVLAIQILWLSSDAWSQFKA